MECMSLEAAAVATSAVLTAILIKIGRWAKEADGDDLCALEMTVAWGCHWGTFEDMIIKSQNICVIQQGRLFDRSSLGGHVVACQLTRCPSVERVPVIRKGACQ